MSDPDTTPDAIDDAITDAPPPAAATPLAEHLYQQASDAHDAEDYRLALRLIDQALDLSPHDSACWNAKGVFLRKLDRLPEALTSYRRALELTPDASSGWSNLGTLLRHMRYYQAAIACHEKSVLLKPRDSALLHNKGIMYSRAGRFPEAVESFSRALLFKPGAPEIRWDRALAELHLGDFAQGWVDYEARLEHRSLRRKSPGVAWRGQPYPNQHLVIAAEQGFGDTIWAARYLQIVKALGGRLTMECRPELIPLIASMNLVDDFAPYGKTLPQADLHISICSLPGLFTPNLAAVPTRTYLQASPEGIAKIASLLPPPAQKKRVGIVWSGNIKFKGNGDRAVTLDRFLSAFNLPGVQLFSLQKGEPAEELQAHPNASIIDLGPHLQDFADTAAAVTLMDVVIMTDSAVAHLAGALNKPVWVLLGDAPAWFWFTERPDSPWYKSMTIFRQRASGDWTAPFDAAATRLIKGNIS